MSNVKGILIIGLFLSEKNRATTIRTAADQLAELLSKNGYAVLKVSDKIKKVQRFLETINVILRRRKEYNIAVLPIYGGYNSFIWADISSRILKWLKKKTVLIVHGGSIPQKMRLNPGRYYKILKRADKIVCPSGFLQETLKQHGFESVEIENVLNLNEYIFHPKENFRPCLLWMRTFEKIYNPEMAVRVAAILSKRFPEFKMVMAGFDNGSLSSVKQLASNLGVVDKIEFPGYIDIQQKNKYASECDIYICTNKIDNAPVSVIEMMCLGLPVISVNTGGIPFLVRQNFNGLLVELDNDQEMADKITSIIENSAKGKSIAEEGYKFSRQFGEGPVLEKWNYIFETLSTN